MKHIEEMKVFSTLTSLLTNINPLNNFEVEVEFTNNYKALINKPPEFAKIS